MKHFGIRTVKYLSGILLLLGASIPLARLEMPRDLAKVDNQQAIAIDNVHLVTMNGDEILKNRQLLIRDGLIEMIKPAGSPMEQGFRLIEGNAAYLLPGLFDMHVHIWDRKYQALSLAYGVTSVRNMSGYPMHLRWKKELAEGTWLGSNLFVASPILSGEQYADPLIHRVIREPMAAHKLVRQYKEEGWDFIKIYGSLDADVYEPIIDEASRLGFAVAGHVPYSVIKKTGYQRAAAPLATLEHVEEIFNGPMNYQFDEEKLETVAQDLSAIGATVTPTLMIFDHLTRVGTQKQAYVERLPLQYLNPLVKFVMDKTDGARWLDVSDKQRDHNIKLNNYLLHIVAMLHKHNVNMVLGSDSGLIYTIPGLSTHDEMSLLTKAGLTPYEILKTATINAARVLRVDDQLGSIQLGKVADLIMVEHNPFSSIDILREPVAVIKSGQWLDQKDLQALKNSAKNHANTYLTLGRILEFLLLK